MLKLRDIMTTDVVTLTPDTTLRDAADLFFHRHVSGAPVLRDGGIVGVLSTSDLLEFAGSHPGVPSDRELDPQWADLDATSEPELPNDEPPDAYFTDVWSAVDDPVPEQPAAIEGPEWSALDEHTVEEVMTRRLYALAPGDEIATAASLMNRTGIHRVIVAEEGRLVGVVTVSDITRAVGEGKVRRRTYVFARQPELDQRVTED